MNRNGFRFLSTETGKTIEEQKKSLRSYMKERRGNNENRDLKERLLIENFYRAIFGDSERACTRLSVFIYLSFSSEAPTDGLIERLRSDGHIVYCPRIENGEMQAVAYGEDFSLSEYGIREPIGASFAEDSDVVVLPLLAVDKQGNRLGYGKGYYDRYLQSHKKAKRIAYAFDFQVVDSVPHTELDELVDVIVTEKRIIHCSSERKKLGS